MRPELMGIFLKLIPTVRIITRAIALTVFTFQYY